MASTNRTGRVSAIDYEAGTYEVTYFDRGKSVTRQINAMRRSASALKSRIRTSVKSMVCPLCQKRSGFSPPP